MRGSRIAAAVSAPQLLYPKKMDFDTVVGADSSHHHVLEALLNFDHE
jgi:hypothetical protein